jgi:hypothetical protein
MGSGGTYYDRDTDDGYKRGSAGFSAVAATQMSRSQIDEGLLPKNRRLVCEAKSPIVYSFDVTGSMGNLPMIIFDKMPLIAGSIGENGYLDDPQMSVAAIGDIQGDQAPIQVGDFALLRNMDDWLKRVWREGGGGGQHFESYEMMAYYYAFMCDLPNAVTPFFLITGDEGFRERLYKSDLERHFGGKHETISAEDVFAALKKKFKGNVFLIHRTYSRPTENAEIIAMWKTTLGKERVVHLGSDQSIADVTLGLFAVMSGSRTLDEYLGDMKTARQVAQSDERVAEVRAALKLVATLAPTKQNPGKKSQKPGKSKKQNNPVKKPDRL